MRKTALSSLLLVACGVGWQSSRAKVEEKTNHQTGNTVASSSGGSLNVVHEGPTVTSDSVGGFDQMTFADDTVLESDGGLSAPDGGLPHVKAVRRQAPSSHVVQKGPVDVQAQTWTSSDAGTSFDDESMDREAETGEKGAKVDLFKSPLVWVGAAVLVAAALFALYRYRKFIPFLSFLP